VGREEQMVETLVKDPKAAARAGDVLRYSTSAVLKTGDAARIDRVLTILVADDTPEWARSAMLSGVRHFLPKSAEGRSYAGNLPAEPKPLEALAAKNSYRSASIA